MNQGAAWPALQSYVVTWPRHHGVAELNAFLLEAHMPGLLPNIDPDGLLEYSVVYSDRAMNHMSQ